MTVAARTFGLRDVPLVQGLQRSGAHLDLESAVVDPLWPLSAALRNYYRPFGGRWRSTYVLNGREQRARLRGFVQTGLRASRHEADVLFIAPALAATYGTTAEIWRRLLLHATKEAGAQQLHRLFARLPTGDTDAIEAFRSAGFVGYAQEHVFRLDRQPTPPGPVLTLRPMDRRDNWGVQRLFCHAAPRAVQQVECLPGGTWRVPETASRRPTQRYVWEHMTEVRGYMSLRRGVHGHWVKVVVDEEDERLADSLVTQALHQVGTTPRPVYCSVRSYEPVVQHTLQRLGFRLQASLLILVKATVAPVKEPALNWLAVPERGVEIASTASHLQTTATPPRPLAPERHPGGA
ncbi:MAG: hypothetical protein U0768_07670 [Anaerolineae bacterium]